jgi:ribonuclease BN (tRNA processing enzyme)
MATLASSKVDRVVLTHYVPAYEDQADVENFKRGIAPAFMGPVILARDLDCF